MSIIQGNSQTAASGFNPDLIGNSVWLDGSADHLTRSTTSHSSTECVMACWVQLSTSAGNIGLLGLGTGTSGSTNNGIWFSDGTLYVYVNGNGLTTNAKYRGIGYYHFLASFKLDEGAAADKSKVFVNGVEVTSFAADPRGSWGTSFASTATQSVGSNFTNTFLNGSVTQAIMLDGQSIQAGDFAITDFVDSFTFGSNGSQFGPKADADIATLASSAGGNSFCLNFEDGSNLGNDSSSNNNDFSATSMAAANQSTSTPSNVFATLNPLKTGAAMTLSEGSTRVVNGASVTTFGSIPLTTGKWYWEIESLSNPNNGIIGIGRGTQNHTLDGFRAGFAAMYAPGANQWYVDGSSVTVADHVAINSGVRVMIAFDGSSGKLWFGVDGTWLGSGDPAADSNPNITGRTEGDYFPIYSNGTSPSTDFQFNFGGGSQNIASAVADENGFGQFEYTPPSGFLSLCSANVEPQEIQGVDHFATTLAQEGSLFAAMNTAESAYSATLRIYKSRASASASETWGYNFSHDASNEYILPAANTAMTYGSIRSLSGTDNWVGYSLDISSSAGTAAGSASHSNGSDTTVTHSLGSSRYIVLLFNRSGGDIFYYHPDVASGSLLKFNSSVLPFSSTVITDITTNSFDIGSAAASATYDYLVLAETPGMTDVFSYIGNSSTDGPYLNLNAQPEFWTAKLITTHATEHVVFDKTREPFNDSSMINLLPNHLSAESDVTGFATDLLSTAVKLRNASTDLNFTGGTFVGWAFGKIAGGGTLPPVYGK